mgnify:FL=1
MGFFDKNENNPASLLSKLNYDCLNLNNITLGIIGIIIQSFFVLLVATIAGIIFDWRITLAMLAFTPLFILSNYLYSFVSKKQNEKQEEYQLEATQIQSECILNSKTVFGYNFQKYAVKHFKNILILPMRNFKITCFKFGVLFGITQFIRYIPVFISFYLGAKYFDNDSEENGNVVKAILIFFVSLLYLSSSSKYIGDISNANDSLKNQFINKEF